MKRILIIIFLLVTLVYNAHAQFYSGSYTGNGTSLSITAPGFQPDMVYIKKQTLSGTGQLAVIRVAGMSTTVDMGGVGNATDRITSLDASGFSVSSSGTVNTSGEVYDYVAIKSKADELSIGSYTGDGTDNRDLSVLSFQPDFVFILSPGQSNVFRTSSLTGDNSLLVANSSGVANYIQALNSNGFQVGTDAAVNTSSTVYYYIAAKAVSGKFAVGSYTGNGVDNRAITGLGFAPGFVIVKGLGQNPAIKSTSSGISTDLAFAVAASLGASNVIQKLLDDGIEIGTGSRVNTNTTSYYWFAFAENALWTGATNSTWSTGTNWTRGMAPASTSSVEIPAVTNYPDISSGTVTMEHLLLDASTSTITTSGGTIVVNASVVGAGSITGSATGVLTLNGAAGTVNFASGARILQDLNIGASGSATLGTALSVNGTLTVTNGGTLATGGNLTLSSTATGTARIAAGNTAGSYITGNVTVERFIPGRRAYRFFAHPFSSSIALSQLTDDIDITGSGGASNGFTASGTNNPSSFWYDVTAGDNSTTGNNPGWTAFTNTNGSGANAWPQYGAARILVRGAIGEGLNGGSYTPSDVTLDMTGAVNQGNTTISLTKGSGTSFVLVGNPFPSQVDMDALSSSSVGSAFYIWDATAGTRGAYTSYSYGSSSFALPSCGSFVTTLSANGSITFNESAKTNLTSGTMFKTTAAPNTVQLRMEDSTTFWDRLLLRFDNNATATVDYPDAAKLYNPDISFYTFSHDDSMLSIDARPYTDGEVIKLGLYSTLQKSFKIRASDFNMPAGTKLYLNDKYLNKVEEITGAGYEYWFTVNADTASWGNKRFELNTKGTPTTTGIANAIPQLNVKLVPNPTTDNVTIYIDGITKANTTITVTDIMGVKILSLNAGDKNSILLDTRSLASGIYMVMIHNDGQTITQKLIKQ